METNTFDFTIRSKGSRCYMTDVSLELEQRHWHNSGWAENEPVSTMARLVTVSLDESRDVKLFPLVKGFEMRWDMVGSIELPAIIEGVHIIAELKGGWDFIQLLMGVTPSSQGHSQNALTCDERSHQTIRWKICDIPQDPTVNEKDHSSWLVSLGNYHIQCFNITHNLSIIPPAVRALQRAVDLTPADHPDLTNRLHDLGHALTLLFEHKEGSLSDIASAIEAYHRAISLTPDGHPRLRELFNKLGCASLYRFQHSGDLAHIADAVAGHQRAVDLTPAGHESLPCVLHNLGNSLQARFQRTGNSCDIYRATEAHQKAVNIAPVGLVELPLLLENLGNSYTCRFQCTNNISDINTAVAVHQRAAELSSPRRAGLFGSFSYLGTSLLYRFGHLGNPSDLEQAVAAHARAVELTPSGNTDLPRWLFNLSSSLQARFEHFGNLHDIAEAISANQKAVKITPDRHALLPIYLRSLGKSLMRRFEHMGNLSDIDAAISLQQRAVGLIPHDHAAYTDLQSSLGNSLLTRFDRTGKLSDIDAAILAQQEAVQLTSSGNPSLYYALSSLGVSLRRRFESGGNSLDISDIDEAVAAHQRAHHLMPTGHHDLPAILHNYGSSLLRRFKHTKDISDILKALEAHQKALELASTGLPSLPKFKTSLGHSFSSRGEFTGNRDDLAAGMGHYKSAATCGFGSPLLRMKAARCWIQSSCNLDLESPQTLAACDTAISLISEVAGLEQTVQCRHAQLQELTGLVDDISALGCILGRTDKALEWLEQGRCLVWAQLSLLRTPFDDLRTHNIELAQQFMHVSRQLDIASSRPDVSWARGERSIVAQISVENEAQLHFKLSKEWKELLYIIRSTVPGLKDFLRPSPCSNLLQNLPDGPIVLFSIHPARCDALALRRGFDEPFHIQLPDFSRQEADIYCKDLKTHLQQNNLRMRGGEQETELDRGLRPHRERGAPRRVLAGLWNKVVKPILDALEFSKIDLSSGVTPPRIWWCPTGALSFLPLHAAGRYGEGGSETTLDYVVSSYTPSVTSLTDRVKNDRPIAAHLSGLFLTSQPDTPGYTRIPGTTAEVNLILEHAIEREVRAMKLNGSDVTVEEALNQMENFSCIHLACHASQKAEEPLQSSFLFHSGSLDLATIIRKDLKNADLAFLSACQTSTGEEKLAGEAVHLAAGMLAAGYRRVVATMWAIKDKHAPGVAQDFYSYLLSHQETGTGFDGSHSAFALHHAIQRLRQKIGDSDESLLTWIPYVHYGL